MAVDALEQSAAIEALALSIARSLSAEELARAALPLTQLGTTPSWEPPWVPSPPCGSWTRRVPPLRERRRDRENTRAAGKCLRPWCFDYKFENSQPLTMAAVSMAIMSSSLVGISRTFTLESAAEMTASLPRVLLASASIFTPMNSRPEAMAIR